MGNGTFRDVATQTMDWQNRPNADTHGASWADFNNDGDQDLMVTTGTGNLSQFLVNENQRLVDRTVNPDSTSPISAAACRCGWTMTMITGWTWS